MDARDPQLQALGRLPPAAANPFCLVQEAVGDAIMSCMREKAETSDLSGVIVDADAGTPVTVVFGDGHRQLLTVTAAEAADLRGRGVNRTSTLSRARNLIPVTTVSKWVITTLVAALIGAWVSDYYADRQQELQMEGELITHISRASIQLFQDAQNAARATPDDKQQALRDKAADAWVLESGSITPVIETYYGDRSQVYRNWYAYQDAMYSWAVLGCCTRVEGRPADVKKIRDYLESRVGSPRGSAPVGEPWENLVASERPAGDLYQWVGRYLLRGRGSILRDLRDDDPLLD